MDGMGTREPWRIWFSPTPQILRVLSPLGGWSWPVDPVETIFLGRKCYKRHTWSCFIPELSHHTWSLLCIILAVWGPTTSIQAFFFSSVNGYGIHPNMATTKWILSIRCFLDSFMNSCCHFCCREIPPETMEKSERYQSLWKLSHGHGIFPYMNTLHLSHSC